MTGSYYRIFIDNFPEATSVTFTEISGGVAYFKQLRRSSFFNIIALHQINQFTHNG